MDQLKDSELLCNSKTRESLNEGEFVHFFKRL